MNNFVEWNDTYSVQIAELDNQHKRLFEMINAFYASSLLTKTDLPLRKIISDMKFYALEHFRTEEKIMYDMGFPRVKSHVIRHNDFIKKVIDLETKIEKGNPVMASDILRFLKNWITDHIKTEDQIYAQYLINNKI
jgi:hemerythrin-like metal-binding protein